MGLEINPKLLIRLRGDTVTTDMGYTFMKRFLERKREPFTALFTYNDRTAIGAIRAIQEAGLRVPEDISVVGFDEIESAAYHNPAITTVRQPLQRMGEIAARTLLNRIENSEPYLPEIAIEPELVVRHSTRAHKGNR
jgi:LacI family transcriptional regulator